MNQDHVLPNRVARRCPCQRRLRHGARERCKRPRPRARFAAEAPMPCLVCHAAAGTAGRRPTPLMATGMHAAQHWWRCSQGPLEPACNAHAWPYCLLRCCTHISYSSEMLFCMRAGVLPLVASAAYDINWLQPHGRGPQCIAARTDVSAQQM